MTKPITTHRYYLPNINGEGWAEIIVCSTGFFAAVSDYGNYAYAWRSFGDRDFREFLLNSERDWDYFANKLCEGEREYDGKATLRGVKDEILRCRRDGDWTREQARCEWDVLTECGQLRDEQDFRDWLDARTRARDCGEPIADWDDVWHEAHYRIPIQAEAFVKKVMGRLCPILREDLGLVAKGAA